MYSAKLQEASKQCKDHQYQLQSKMGEFDFIHDIRYSLKKLMVTALFLVSQSDTDSVHLNRISFLGDLLTIMLISLSLHQERND